MIRVLLVEDDTTVRALVEMLLSTEPDFDLVGVTDTAEEGVELVGSLLPDLVLLDNQLLGPLTGPEAAPAMKAAHPDVVVLLCTAFDADPTVGVAPGLDGFLRKEGLFDLVDVVRELFGSAGSGRD